MGFLGTGIIVAVIKHDGTTARISEVLNSPSRKMLFFFFFCDCCGQKSLILQRVFLINVMEYVGFLYNEIAGTCKNYDKQSYDITESAGDI